MDDDLISPRPSTAKDEHSAPAWAWVGVWLGIAALLVGSLGLIRIAAADERRDELRRVPEAVDVTPSTAGQTTNLPPPLTEPAVTSAQAERQGQQIQLTEPIPPPPPAMPVAIPGDCGSWQQIFRWYGATDEEIYFFFVSTPWGRKNVIWHESMCGTRFRNPDTSDTGICQLNGVHRSWVMSEFGLRLGSGVGEAEASNPYYAAACLRLLRGESNAPNAMKYACAWRPGRFCS